MIFRCRACGAEHKHWAPIERHARSERHHRVEILIPEPGEATE